MFQWVNLSLMAVILFDDSNSPRSISDSVSSVWLVSKSFLLNHIHSLDNRYIILLNNSSQLNHDWIPNIELFFKFIFFEANLSTLLC
jgi:hypothetical protein